MHSCVCEHMYITFFLLFFSPSLKDSNLKSPLIPSDLVLVIKSHLPWKIINVLTLHFPLPLLLVSYFYFRWTTPLNPSATQVRITEKARHKQKLYRKEQTMGLTRRTFRPQIPPCPVGNNTPTTTTLFSPKVIQLYQY